MDKRTVDKPISITDAISGKLEGVNYNLFLMKDKDFTIKLISVYRKLDAQSNAQDKIWYIEIVKRGRIALHSSTLNHSKTIVGADI